VDASRSPAARRVVQGLLRGSALVAVATGAGVVARGSAAVPGGGEVAPSTDSVLRFYAAWWVAAGAAMWCVAAAPERNESAVRAVAATTFAGGVARLLAMRRSGLPHPLFRALTVVELVTPPVLLALQRRLADRSGQEGHSPRGSTASSGRLSTRSPRQAACRSLPSAVSTR
jgi:hypothetical protein